MHKYEHCIKLNLKQTLKLFFKVTLIMSSNLCVRINNLYAKLVIRILNMMNTFKINLISCTKIIPSIYRKIYVYVLCF